jgi:hypothetical protein
MIIAAKIRAIKLYSGMPRTEYLQLKGNAR